MRFAPLILALAFTAACADQATQPVAVPLAPAADRDASNRGPVPGFDRLQHVVVIYLENHSFDNLYGSFPGANGLANAGAAATQVDGSGNPFTTLPQTGSSPFPTTLANRPFDITQFVPSNMKIPDLVHRFYQEQTQIDGGRMDRFAFVSDAKGESMGFYPTATLPLAAEAAQYTLCDNFFHAAFGGSFLNHMWLIAARTPVFPNALAGNPDPLFQFHHQPFIYFFNYRDGTTAKAQHLKDETEFFSAAQNGTLPAVSFIKPLGPDNEHPGYADMMTGEQHVLDLIDAIRNGPDWRNTAIIITYDEHGGFWDHVAPPVVDRWGPGSRVPTIIISPFAKRHNVDHHRYDTTSILAFIERRWGLAPLTDRDANANDLTAAFDFAGNTQR